jgi:hypothetical protein
MPKPTPALRQLGWGRVLGLPLQKFFFGLSIILGPLVTQGSELVGLVSIAICMLCSYSNIVYLICNQSDCVFNLNNNHVSMHV